MGCGGGGGGVTDVGVLSPTLSVQLPEPPPNGYTVTVCVPDCRVPPQESALVPPWFVQEEVLTRQSMSLSMPVRLTLTSVPESRLNSYDFSPAPVSDTANGSV